MSPLLKLIGVSRLQQRVRQEGLRGGTLLTQQDTTDANSLVAWASDLLQARGQRVVAAEEIGRGSQSVLVRLDTSGGNSQPLSYALKIFRSSVAANSHAAVREETAALGILAAALEQSDGSVTCPHPVAIADASLGYLMTYSEGISLNKHLRRGGEITSLLRPMVEGLQTYYASVGRAYADLTPENVLVQDDGVVTLLDPTFPGPLFARLEASALNGLAAVDMGFWLQDVAGKTVRMCFEDPILHLRRVLFTRSLLRVAAETFAPHQPRAFLREALSVARYHLRRYRRGLGPLRRSIHWFMSNSSAIAIVILARQWSSRR